jgi:hypothetical protein
MWDDVVGLSRLEVKNIEADDDVLTLVQAVSIEKIRRADPRPLLSGIRDTNETVKHGRSFAEAPWGGIGEPSNMSVTTARSILEVPALCPRRLVDLAGRQLREHIQSNEEPIGVVARRSH